jgi:hypothetical protein
MPSPFMILKESAEVSIGFYNLNIKVEENHLGYFQFGLVSEQLDGEIEEVGNETRFLFTWDGTDDVIVQTKMDRVFI